MGRYRGITLGIVSDMSLIRNGNRGHVHFTFGRVVDRLAAHFGGIYLCCPTRETGRPESCDYALQAGNIQFIAQPYYASSREALGHPWGILRAYWRVCLCSDLLFVRGMPPYVGLLYLLAWFHGRRPCHWIVGNPVALLKSHRRYSWLGDCLSLAYAYQDRFFTRLGNGLTRGAFICNGGELAEIYRSPRTVVAVSSTITEGEFYEREDTCLRDPIRILFVGFVRPEKGLEYLIEAVSKLKTKRSWELVILGSWDKFVAYKRRLDMQIERLGIGSQVRWAGYVSYGPALWEFLRQSDLLVLPTLSEGTPRVLVEARANGLPIISTAVGGIPTSVADGVDGLLVAPKDADALAWAIDRVIGDGELRRSLIRNGLRSARGLTVDRFVKLVLQTLQMLRESRG